MMAGILNSAALNSAILDLAILHKRDSTNTFSLNMMMVAILNSVILELAILHKTLPQTNLI